MIVIRYIDTLGLWWWTIGPCKNNTR